MRELIVENALKKECVRCILVGMCERSHETKTLVVVENHTRA